MTIGFYEDKHTKITPNKPPKEETIPISHVL